MKSKNDRLLKAVIYIVISLFVVATVGLMIASTGAFHSCRHQPKQPYHSKR